MGRPGRCSQTAGLDWIGNGAASGGLEQAATLCWLLQVVAFDVPRSLEEHVIHGPFERLENRHAFEEAGAWTQIASGMSLGLAWEVLRTFQGGRGGPRTQQGELRAPCPDRPSIVN